MARWYILHHLNIKVVYMLVNIIMIKDKVLELFNLLMVENIQDNGWMVYNMVMVNFKKLMVK